MKVFITHPTNKNPKASMIKPEGKVKPALEDHIYALMRESDSKANEPSQSIQALVVGVMLFPPPDKQCKVNGKDVTADQWRISNEPSTSITDYPVVAIPEMVKDKQTPKFYVWAAPNRDKYQLFSVGKDQHFYCFGEYVTSHTTNRDRATYRKVAMLSNNLPHLAQEKRLSRTAAIPRVLSLIPPSI